ncbi:MAG TPA: hypothetical protein VH352_26905 [Pseudonocardiaceae bacterium]|jgi:type IV secretory pathway VirB2 component (pilin)|nr:hypothetical protein [Pseudonocardiaceae bacterium]
MHSGRILAIIATIAFGIAAAFGLISTSTAHPSNADQSVVQPFSGFPYD